MVSIALFGLAMMLWIWTRNRSKSAQRVSADSGLTDLPSRDDTSALSKTFRGPQQRR